MSDPAAAQPIDLDRLPAEALRASVVYLDDALRECQLVLVAQGQGHVTDPDLGTIAAALVPAIEEVADAFRAAEMTVRDDGSVRLVGSMRFGQAATVAHLQAQLGRLRTLGLEGALLLESGPEVGPLLSWICEEVIRQLQGRPARPYHPVR